LNKQKSNSINELLDLITLDQAAKLRSVTRPAISYLVSQGKLKRFEMFGRVLVNRKEVIEYKPSKGGRPAKAKAKK
jgi:hypothetical protein